MGRKSWRRVAVIAAAGCALLAALPDSGSGKPPRSGRIAFVRVFGEYQLFTVAGGGRVQIGKDLASRRDPALSPDGSQVAYTRLVNGSWGLWVSDLDGTGAHQLVADIGGWDGSPTWSPDGTAIAYGMDRSGSDYAIYTVPRLGGVPTRVTPAGEHAARPAWSPDGTTLADEIWKDQNWHIATIGVDGTGEKQLTTDAAFAGGPAWSPDGKQIAYEHDTGKATEIWTMNADGTGAHAVTTESSATDEDPSFLADGSGIVYSSDRSGRTGIWVTTVENPIAIQLLAPTTSGGALLDPSLGATGRLVFAASDASVREIMSVAADGSGLRQVTHDGSWDSLPAWSPDRRTVYFDALRDGRDHVWKVGAGGAGETHVGPQDGNRAPLQVSPDGKRLLVLSDEGGSFEPFVIGTNGRGSRWLLRRPLPDVGSASWSPDGRRVVVSAKAGIYVVAADGGGLKRLPWSHAGDADPMWSPTGDSIVFTSTRSGEREVWSAPVGGRKAKRLTHGTGAPETPVWSPDGRSIAYVKTDADGLTHIWVMAANGAHPRAIARSTDYPDLLPAWR